MGSMEDKFRAPVLSAELEDDRENRGPEYAIFDELNPRSVINLVPETVRVAMRELSDRWRLMSETELWRKCKPDPVDGRLRLAFWDEYNLAQIQHRDMNMTSVVRNITSMDYWVDRVMTSDAKLAFIVIPPKDYMVAMKTLLERGLDRYHEFLELPVVETRYSPKGKEYQVTNSSLIGQMIKIIESLQMRVHGAVVQRQLNVNLNGHGNMKPMTEEEVDRELRMVRERLEDLKRKVPVEDGDVVDGD